MSQTGAPAPKADRAPKAKAERKATVTPVAKGAPPMTQTETTTPLDAPATTTVPTRTGGVSAPEQGQAEAPLPGSSVPAASAPPAGGAPQSGTASPDQGAPSGSTGSPTQSGTSGDSGTPPSEH